jgi:membrane glycosyltransferase
MRLSMMSMRWRRRGFAALVVASSAGLCWLMARTLSVSSSDPLGIAMLGLFALTLPWTAIGFWNAVIGFSLMQFSRDPELVVAPDLHHGRSDDRIISSTALLICIRNEDTQLIRRNLEWMLDALVTTGQAHCFHLYMLSDSNQPETAAAEEQAAAALSKRFGSALEITYRRREHSEGFKAGNLREFCGRWGHRHDFAIVLDADLAILGADPAEYQAYVNGVRAEYAHVDAAGWRTGRAAVLRHFLGLTAIYRTPTMRVARERRAQANLTAELAALGEA